MTRWDRAGLSMADGGKAPPSPSPWLAPLRLVGRVLLSIALCPLFLPTFWHHHFGKLAAAWSLAFLVPFWSAFGTEATAVQVAHTLILEYVPFILVLFALYTIAGGIRVERDRMHRSLRPLHAVLASRPLVGIRRHVGARCQFGQRERANRSLDRQVLRVDPFEVDDDRGVEQPARDAASLRHAGLGQDQRWRRGRGAAGRGRLAARR